MSLSAAFADTNAEIFDTAAATNRGLFGDPRADFARKLEKARANIENAAVNQVGGFERFRSIAASGSVEPKYMSPIETQFGTKLTAVMSPTPVPAPARQRYSLQPIQEWEGVVTSITDSSFSAALVDVTAGSKESSEIAEFPIEEVSEEDQKLLRDGAIFRWVIGYQRSSTGTKRRVSELVFRRLPAWREVELRKSRERAKNIIKDIAWE